MDDRSIKELPDFPWIIYTPLASHGQLKVHIYYVIAGMVNLTLLALYISAAIWIVRGLT